MDLVHEGVLRKIEFLKGNLIVGKVGIKGNNSNERLPPDQYVPEAHILHNLVRGFYKPAGKPYILSYQATESSKNYGKQIIWKDTHQNQFLRIEMAPPKSDIEVARYNLNHNIPIGILYKIKKAIIVSKALVLLHQSELAGPLWLNLFHSKTVHRVH
ncbi:hypothetical protein G8C92_28130 [Paenibacillus donghaensis]|uniref:hypothetical protein n=1 Tax=Paenibacillus donghaensis TaxID=414771 RepID=UPI0018846B92|nr:hypothetical protein [Paenibacillus donghaensis]MBE9917873.1 hypothetical protein [Paenibacillus donghaensis]